MLKPVDLSVKTSPSKRPQTPEEEFANSLSHGLGAAAILLGTPLLILNASQHGRPAVVIGVTVFAVAAAVLYLASSIYHALPAGKRKEQFGRFDHAAIFVLIAGSYTPFTLGVLRGAWGWTLFGLVWAIAIGGMIYKLFFNFRSRALSNGLYLGMGWLIVIAAQPMWERMPKAGLLWLAAGGLAYTLGVLFYNANRLLFSHFIWHLFVLAGTACHYCAILWYSA